MRDFIKNAISSMFGTLLAISIIIFIVGGLIVSLFIAMMSSAGNFNEEELTPVKPSILQIKLSKPITDQRTIKPDMFTLSLNQRMGLRDITLKIKQAKNDRFITGIYLDLSSIYAGFATIQEIRDTLIDFKKSGKFIIAHADSYTHATYYLASVADKVFLTPEGDLELTGLSSNVMFFKSLFDKMGIKPIVFRHGKFKSAVEPFLLNSISDANREQIQKYTDSLWNTMIGGISQQRKIPIEKINTFADTLSITTANSALENKLVDGLKYKDQVYDELKKKTKSDKLNFVSLEQYRITTDFSENSTSNKIAVIYATGSIASGEGNEQIIGSETLSQYIREARNNDKIKAIVLRINSPGGSALASEVIWRETILAKQKKPLIVSFGDVAASGGYYIACAADTIVAEPNTITGSIGVFGLLFNTKSLMNNIGVNINTITTNKYSDIANPMRKLTEYEEKVMQAGVENVYKTFVTHVAEGRNKTFAEIDRIGQGRVWTGADAKKIGLVDTIGGLNDSILLAAQKAGIKEYNIISYPQQDKIKAFVTQVLGGVKSSMIQEELGNSYHIYQKIKQIKAMTGIQARTPYFFDFND